MYFGENLLEIVWGRVYGRVYMAQKECYRIHGEWSMVEIVWGREYFRECLG